MTRDVTAKNVMNILFDKMSNEMGYLNHKVNNNF